MSPEISNSNLETNRGKESIDVELHSTKKKANREERLSYGSSRKVPDGGWAWMVVFGSFINMCLLGGINRSFGILYIQLRTRYSSSSALTNWVGASSHAIRMLCGPVASWLCQRFHCRSLIIAGGLVFSLGFFLSAFAVSAEYMLFSYGIFVGIGGMLIHIPTQVHVSHCFEKKRAKALGIAGSAVGLGMFTFTPMLEYLFSNYGFFGTMLILSGVVLNFCVAGALHRPLTCDVTQNTSVNLMESDAEATRPSIRDKLKACRFDLSLFTNRVCLLLAFSTAMWLMAVIISDGVVVDMARSKGISVEKSVLIMSIYGIMDTISRVLFGWLFDMPFIKMKQNYIYNMLSFICGVCLYCWPFLTSFEAMAVCGAVVGLMTGALMSLRAVIIVGLLGIKSLAPALGILSLVPGICILIGPYFAGFLRDYTGDYTATFIFSGALCTLAAILFALATFFKQNDCNKQVANKTQELVQENEETI